MESIYKSNENAKRKGLGLRDRDSNKKWEEVCAL